MEWAGPWVALRVRSRLAAGGYWSGLAALRRSGSRLGQRDGRFAGLERAGRDRLDDSKRGVASVRQRALLGHLGVLLDDGLEDGLVLVPDLLPPGGPPQDLAHYAPQVVPVQAHRLRQERVAGDPIDPHVELHV